MQHHALPHDYTVNLLPTMLEHDAQSTLICDLGINLPLLAFANKQGNWLWLGIVHVHLGFCIQCVEHIASKILLTSLAPSSTSQWGLFANDSVVLTDSQQHTLALCLLVCTHSSCPQSTYTCM